MGQLFRCCSLGDLNEKPGVILCERYAQKWRDVGRNTRSALRLLKRKASDVRRHGRLGGRPCDDAAQYAVLAACNRLRLRRNALRLLRPTLT
jgi:hypothetical protein